MLHDTNRFCLWFAILFHTLFKDKVEYQIAKIAYHSAHSSFQEEVQDSAFRKRPDGQPCNKEGCCHLQKRDELIIDFVHKAFFKIPEYNEGFVPEKRGSRCNSRCN